MLRVVRTAWCHSREEVDFAPLILRDSSFDMRDEQGFGEDSQARGGDMDDGPKAAARRALRHRLVLVVARL